MGLLDAGFAAGAGEESGGPRGGVRRQEHFGGWQRRGGGGPRGERSGGWVSRRRRAAADRSEDDAHEGTRAARSGRVRAAGDVRLLEGTRPDRALREIFDREQDVGRQNETGD